MNKEKKGKVVDSRCRDLTSAFACEKGRTEPGSVPLCSWHEVSSQVDLLTGRSSTTTSPATSYLPEYTHWTMSKSTVKRREFVHISRSEEWYVSVGYDFD